MTLGESDLGRRTAYDWLRSAGTFYVVTPLTIALLYASLRSGLAALMPFPKGLLFWTLLILPAWWAAHAMACVAHFVLRPWTPPLWLICVLGSVSQALLLSPFYRMYHSWAASTLTSGAQLVGNWPLPAFTIEYAVSLLWVLTPGAIIWTSINYFYDRLLNVPRFRYTQPATSGAPQTPPTQLATSSAPPPQPAQSASEDPVQSPPASPSEPAASVDIASPPPLLTRSKLPATAEIIALTAEEHYVRLYTDAGTDLVRYRFSDALEEMAGVASGMQVHRSWWVRIDRVINWHIRGRSYELELEQGLRVPTSLAFREAVLARAPAEVRDRARRGAQREQRRSGT
jgi:hypothetical protein